MAKTYVEVTELEFDALLQSAKGWNKEVKGNEYVYSYALKKQPNVSILVYSTVTPTGLGRKCGGDAIRICAINTKTNKGVRKSVRVYRVAGWEQRTQDKIVAMIKDITEPKPKEQ